MSQTRSFYSLLREQHYAFKGKIPPVEIKSIQVPVPAPVAAPVAVPPAPIAESKASTRPLFDPRAGRVMFFSGKCFQLEKGLVKLRKPDSHVKITNNYRQY